MYQAKVNITGKRDSPRKKKQGKDSSRYDDGRKFKPNQDESYIGITGGLFKQRYYNHRNTFKDPSKRNSTMLSEYVCN